VGLTPRALPLTSESRDYPQWWTQRRKNWRKRGIYNPRTWSVSKAPEILFLSRLHTQNNELYTLPRKPPSFGCSWPRLNDENANKALSTGLSHHSSTYCLPVLLIAKGLRDSLECRRSSMLQCYGRKAAKRLHKSSGVVTAVWPWDVWVRWWLSDQDSRWLKIVMFQIFSAFCHNHWGQP
jgi:hypothetical protein